MVKIDKSDLSTILAILFVADTFSSKVSERGMAACLARSYYADGFRMQFFRNWFRVSAGLLRFRTNCLVALKPTGLAVHRAIRPPPKRKRVLASFAKTLLFRSHTFICIYTYMYPHRFYSRLFPFTSSLSSISLDIETTRTAAVSLTVLTQAPCFYPLQRALLCPKNGNPSIEKRSKIILEFEEDSMFCDTFFENWEDELSELSNSFLKRMIYKREVILLKMNTTEKASKYLSRKHSYVDIIVSEK